MSYIIAVHEDRRTRGRIARALAEVADEIVVTGSAAEMTRLLARRTPQLLILGDSLNSLDAADICRQLRSDDGLSRLSVLVVTPQRPVAEVLDAGADSVVGGVFEEAELAAYVRALLRFGMTGAYPASESLPEAVLPPTEGE